MVRQQPAKLWTGFRLEGSSPSLSAIRQSSAIGRRPVSKAGDPSGHAGSNPVSGAIFGEMAERLIAPVLKAGGRRDEVSWVRIPFSPPLYIPL